MPDEKTNDAVENTKDAAGDALENAKEVAGNVWDKAKELAGEAKERIEDAINADGKTKDGSEDTRGLFEKVADAVTGDNKDDATGKEVN
ncbi:MAG: hypothetical protein H0W86_02750 [Armatimonadetes bacterium]|nr:hypothetical protein [Armatimonadota bacterium]